MTITEIERRRRLKSMLTQIAPNSDLGNLRDDLRSSEESFTAHESIGGSGFGNREYTFAKESLEHLVNDGAESIDHEQLGSLEAIIHKRYRPAIYVENDSFKKGPAPWDRILEGNIRPTIESTIPSVGRIELPNHPRYPYGGTGFVVGSGLIMTNRHVAEIFTTGIGSQLNFKPGLSAAIDFKQEQGSSESLQLSVHKVLMIHPYWDMALLQVSGLAAKQKPLELSVTDTEELTGSGTPRHVVAIGYPAQDRRNDFDDQNRIFGRFDVKRLQPGELRVRRDFPSYGRNVKTVTHDCSTLGGNSGSAVLDLKSGQIVGLHFAGQYMDANFAVPAFELARDSQVVDSGVNFAGTLPASDFYPRVWEQAGSNSKIDPDLQPEPLVADDRTSVTPTNRDSGDGGTSTQLVTLTSGDSEWSVPLTITIKVGTPTISTGETGDRQEFIFGRSKPDISGAKFKIDSLRDDQFSWDAALSTAMAADLAYGNEERVKRNALGPWKFDHCEFITHRRTQCFVATSSKVILVSFRGTQQTNDWLTNLHLRSKVRQPIGRVHSGFYGGFQDVRQAIENEIGTQGNRSMVVTGHSLGGALSTVAAAAWVDKYSINSVYTFGQPAVGKRSFTNFVNENYDDQFFRFVNDDDIVARVPPGFRHVRKLFHFDRRGNLKGAHESIAAQDGDAETMTRAQFEVLKAELESESAVGANNAQEGLLPSISDHSMERYIAKIMKFSN